jgi:hypothetical protein
MRALAAPACRTFRQWVNNGVIGMWQRKAPPLMWLLVFRVVPQRRLSELETATQINGIG